MKPFNLEEAKAGKPVCTRDGRDVTILDYNFKSDFYEGIVVKIKDKNNEYEIVYTVLNNGRFSAGDTECQVDLNMKRAKKTYFANIYKDPFGRIVTGGLLLYDSYEKARKEVGVVYPYLDTIPIEIEE